MKKSILTLAVGLAACAAPPSANHPPNPPAGAPTPASATAAAPGAAPIAYRAPEEIAGVSDASPALRLDDPGGARDGASTLVAVPRGYTAELRVDPASSTIDGRVEIAVDIERPSAVVWLNADGLTFGYAGAQVGGATVPARVARGAHASGFVALVFARPLPVGRATLVVEYRAPISDRDNEGAIRRRDGGDMYVFTQFEPIAARRVFPCFDEPRFKVPWTLVLHVPSSVAAVANTEVRSTTASAGGTMRYEFATTRPLPSYLVAFAVGPFAVTDGGTAGRGATRIRVITPRSRANDVDFAARNTGRLLEQLESYFDIPYPYEKLDIVAVPGMGGAMENPGLVTMGDAWIYPHDDREARAMSYVHVMAHELAHQWFGNLVTSAWWDEIWLNEALATWMALKVVGHDRPGWDVDAWRAQDAIVGTDADALASARQIRQPIRSAGDIDRAFDGITYEKGGAVLRMTETWIGEERFRQGVQQYLRANAGRTATTRDLLSALDAASGRDVSGTISTFLDQPGIPLVRAELTCHAQGASIALAQTRYGASAGAAPTTWRVPLCVRFGSAADEGRACTVLSSPTGALALPSCPAWVVANADASAYAHVIPGARLRGAVAAGVAHASAPEKIALLRDALAAARAGEGDIADALAAIAKLGSDPSPHVVTVALDVARSISDAPLFAPAARAEFEQLVRDAFGARARDLGWEPRPSEAASDALLRGRLVPFVAVEGGDRALQDAARGVAQARVRAALADGILKTPWETLAVAVRFADASFARDLQAAASRVTNRAARIALFRAMGRLGDPSALRAALGLVLDSKLDIRETIKILWSATEPKDSRAIAFDFLRANYDAIVARMPREKAAGLAWVGAALCDAGRRADVEALFLPRAERYPTGKAELTLALEELDRCARTRTLQEANGTRFFRERAASRGEGTEGVRRE